MKQDGIERETNHKRLLISQSKRRVARAVGRVGRGWWGYEHWGGYVLGECCEVCKPGDSQTCTPGANNTLYVNLKRRRRRRLL